MLRLRDLEDGMHPKRLDEYAQQWAERGAEHAKDAALCVEKLRALAGAHPDDEQAIRLSLMADEIAEMEW